MTMQRFPLLALAALLSFPQLVMAEDPETEDTETEDTEAAEDETEKPCKFPTEILYSETDEDLFRLGVSVLNENQQQVPGLKAQHFKVFVDDVEVERSEETFKVRQSKNVFTEAAAEGEPAEGASLGVDPVHYDLYFALDLTESMATPIEVKGQMRSKINVVANRINELFTKEKLFDSNDRVYISGFTSKLETGFMSARTADRKEVTKGLTRVLKFKPQGNDAALYSAMDFNMRTIRDSAESYTSDKERRQAVLIVLTDSFNGMTMNAGRRVRRCRDNESLSEQLRGAVRETSEATNGNFKLYILAVGNSGETNRYKLEGKLSSRCSIRSTQQEVVDVRSFRVITSDLRKGRGGFVGRADPIALLKIVQGQFESLRRAYEISYAPPEGVSHAKKFKVTVELGKESCSDELTDSSGLFSSKTRGKHRPQEAALLLAALILAFFFIPRSLSNLSTVFTGNKSSKPKAAPKKKGKARKKKRK